MVRVGGGSGEVRRSIAKFEGEGGTPPVSIEKE